MPWRDKEAAISPGAGRSKLVGLKMRTKLEVAMSIHPLIASIDNDMVMGTGGNA